LPAKGHVLITCTGATEQFVRIGATNATDSAWTLLTGSLTVPSCPLSGPRAHCRLVSSMKKLV
jgi:hypothetical protein